MTLLQNDFIYLFFFMIISLPLLLSIFSSFNILTYLSLFFWHVYTHLYSFTNVFLLLLGNTPKLSTSYFKSCCYCIFHLPQFIFSKPNDCNSHLLFSVEMQILILLTFYVENLLIFHSLRDVFYNLYFLPSNFVEQLVSFWDRLLLFFRIHYYFSLSFFMFCIMKNFSTT